MQPCASSSKMNGGVKPAQRRAADIVLDVDTAEAKRRRRAQRLDGEGFVLVPKSFALGIISPRAKVRAVAWYARWSSVSSKSMGSTDRKRPASSQRRW